MATVNQLIDRTQARAVTKTLLSEINKSQQRLATAATAAYQPSSYIRSHDVDFSPFKSARDIPLQHPPTIPSFSEIELAERVERSKTKRLMNKVDDQLSRAKARSQARPPPEELSNALLHSLSDSTALPGLMSNVKNINIPIRIAEKRLAVSCNGGIDLKPALYEQANLPASRQDQQRPERIKQYMNYKYEPPVELSSELDFIDNKAAFLLSERRSTAGKGGDHDGNRRRGGRGSFGKPGSLGLAGPEDLRAYFTKTSSPRTSIASNSIGAGVSTGTSVDTATGGVHKGSGDSGSSGPAGSKRLSTRQERSHLRDPLLDAPRQFLPEQTLQNYAEYKASVTINQMPHLEKDVYELETSVERKKFERVIKSPVKLQEKVFQVNPEQTTSIDPCKCDCHSLPQHQIDLLPYLRCPMCLCKIKTSSDVQGAPGTTSFYNHLKNQSGGKLKVTPTNLLHGTRTNVDSLVYRTTVLPPEDDFASTAQHTKAHDTMREEEEDDLQFDGSPLGTINISAQAISPRRAKRLINRGMNKVATRNEKLLRAALQQAILADKLWTDRLLMDISPGITPKKLQELLQKRRYDRAPSTVAVPLIRKTKTYLNKVVNDDLEHDDLLLSSTLPLVQDYDLECDSLVMADTVDHGEQQVDNSLHDDGFHGMNEHSNKEFEDYGPTPTGTQRPRRVRLTVPEDVREDSVRLPHDPASLLWASKFKTLGAQKLKESRNYDAAKVFASKPRGFPIAKDELLARKILYSRQREEQVSRRKEILTEMNEVIKATSSKAQSREPPSGSYYLPPSSSIRMTRGEVRAFQEQIRSPKNIMHPKLGRSKGSKDRDEARWYAFSLRLVYAPGSEHIKIGPTCYFSHTATCYDTEVSVYISQQTLQLILHTIELAHKATSIVFKNADDGTNGNNDHSDNNDNNADEDEASSARQSIYYLVQQAPEMDQSLKQEILDQDITIVTRCDVRQCADSCPSEELCNGTAYRRMEIENGEAIYIAYSDLKRLRSLQQKIEAPTLVLQGLIESQVKQVSDSGILGKTMRKPGNILPNSVISRENNEESTDAIPTVPFTRSSQLYDADHNFALSEHDAFINSPRELDSDDRRDSLNRASSGPERSSASPSKREGDRQQSPRAKNAEEMLQETLRSIYADARLSDEIRQTIVPEGPGSRMEKVLPVRSVIAAINRAQSRLSRLASQADDPA